MGIEVGSMQSELIKAMPRSRVRLAVTPEQRRHFSGDLVAWVVVSGILTAVWAATGAGLFWPILPILGFGLGAALFAAFSEPFEGEIEWGISQAQTSPTSIGSRTQENWRASA